MERTAAAQGPARRYEAAVLDLDGAALVADGARAAEIGRLVARLCERGFDVGVASEAPADEVDGSLAARPRVAHRDLF